MLDKIFSQLKTGYMQIFIYSLSFLIIGYIIISSLYSQIMISNSLIIFALPIIIYFDLIILEYIIKSYNPKQLSYTKKFLKRDIFIFIIAFIIILLLPLEINFKLVLIFFSINLIFFLDSRFSLLIAINIFALVPFLLMSKNNNLAEILSITGVLFWMIGTFVNIIEIYGLKKDYEINNINNKNNKKISEFETKIDYIYEKITVCSIIIIILCFFIFNNLSFEESGFFAILYGFLYIFFGILLFTEKLDIKKILNNVFIKYFFIALILPFFYFAINILGSLMGH